MERQAESDGAFRAFLEEQMGVWAVPGVSAAVLDRGRLVAEALGVRRVDSPSPVTTDTLFQVGSITKLFTATALMQLVESGALDLDAPLIDQVPGWKLHDAEATRSLTLRHLLSHTGGTEGDEFFDDDFGRGDDALARCIARFEGLRQLAPPGERWAYCNDGVVLAGFILASVVNEPYETVIRQRILQPLRLEHSVLSLADAEGMPLATGHESASGEAHPLPLVGYPRHLAPAANLISTVGDLLSFAEVHMPARAPRAELLRPETVRLM
jgi:CubicO group peptidase (beta-lactamase class C family)